MSKAVISGIGPDKPGIVAAIGDILLKHGCNIEDSTMTRLAREFAVILIISMPDTVPLAELQKDFTALEGSLGMTTVLKAIPDDMALDSHVPENPCMISVAGHDRAGITFHVARRLAEMSVNITDLNAQVIPGEDGPVYIMMVEVDIPPALTIEAVRSRLQALAKDLGVEIQVRPLEAVAL
jgi:glycine cleavage system transcriptional repressor